MLETPVIALRETRTPRPVVSFVRRSTRMRPPQQRAWDGQRHRFLVPVERADRSTSVANQAPLDVTELFGRPAPLVVEIGPGAGEALLSVAAQRPDLNLLAFEVYQPALAQLIKQLVDLELTNVRLVEADAAEGIRRLVPASSVDEVWTYFPDPWPKARHHKRRIVSPQFADVVSTRLKPDGIWRLATDWATYADHMRTVLDTHPDFARGHRRWAPRPLERPVTKFEQRGLDAGREVFDLAYRRR